MNISFRTILVLGLIMIIVAIYLFYADNFPPRTPVKVARLISGLPIPRNSNVLEFTEEWNDFNGNGFAFIVLKLEEQAFQRVYEQAQKDGYITLPIREGIYGPLIDFSKKSVNGIYKVTFENDSTNSFKGTVLSSNDRTVSIYFSDN